MYTVNLGCLEKCCSEFLCHLVVYRWRKSNVPLTLLYPAHSRPVCVLMCVPQVQRSRNKQMREMFPDGFGIHHAGMLRQDRTLMENMFSRGYIKALVCTATLAWGVNLPAHAVIIKVRAHRCRLVKLCFIKHNAGIFRMGLKWFPCLWYQGTNIYDAKRGALVDLGILDVMQIFGRAGRPQFDKYGEGTIITSHDKLSHYLTLLTQQNPIESQFQQSLADNLNAEVQPHTDSTYCATWETMMTYGINLLF